MNEGRIGETFIEVLIVGGNADDAGVVFLELTSFGYEPVLEQVETAEEMVAALEKKNWDIILADHQPPSLNALSLLPLIKKMNRIIPFILLADFMGDGMIVSAMRAGADDCVLKNNLKRLPPVIEREIHEAKMRKVKKHAQETLECLVSYVPLTNLPNRNLFRDRLQNAIQKGKREERPVAVLVMDVDRFREVNETLGYLFGNVLLQQMGTRLQDALRETDTLTHFGGDAFAALLPFTDAKGAAQVAMKIQQQLNPSFLISDIPISVKISIGISVYPDHGKNMDDLIQKADEAMHSAKKNRRDYFTYTPEKAQQIANQLTLLGDLSQAIENDQLVLHYQPKINRKTSQTVGVEALVRWQHPEHGLLMPDQFIPLAEKTDLIKLLAFWTLHAAIRQSAAWQQTGHTIPILVNLSAPNLHDEEMAGKIAEWLKSYGISPTQIKLAFTESALVADPVRTKESLARFSRIGIGVSVKKIFGTGYFSLSFLRKLPLEEFKLDRLFIARMMESETDAVIASCMLDLGRNLGVTTVAEGVENEEIFNLLNDLGCDVIQGYYLCPPLPADRFITWLAESPYDLVLLPRPSF